MCDREPRQSSSEGNRHILRVGISALPSEGEHVRVSSPSQATQTIHLGHIPLIPRLSLCHSILGSNNQEVSSCYFLNAANQVLNGCRQWEALKDCSCAPPPNQVVRVPAKVEMISRQPPPSFAMHVTALL